MKTNYVNWLASNEVDIFVTVTLKQSILNNEGVWVPISQEDIRKTAWILRDRVMKAVGGRRRKFPFFVFSEGDGYLTRSHLHIVTKRPPNLELSSFRIFFREKSARLDWVYDEIDVREISPQTQHRVISYSLKGGTGAFIPEASWVPITN